MIWFFNTTATAEIYTYVHTRALHDALPICAARADGRLQGGCRDGFSLLSGHEGRRPGRSLAGRLGGRAGDHQGDRELLSALDPPALPGPSHAKPGRQGP